MTKCIICGNNWSVNTKSEGDPDGSTTYTCPICHAFKVTKNFSLFFPNEPKDIEIWKLQGALREVRKRNNSTICLFNEKSVHQGKNDYTIDELISSVVIPETPEEKIDKFVLNYASTKGGTMLSVNTLQDFPEAYAQDQQEFRWLLDTANKLNLFSNYRTQSAGPFKEGQQKSTNVTFQLSVKAWERIHNLRTTNLDSRKVFIACWFGDKHDKYRKTVEEAVSICGYSPMSIKERHYPETIISKALKEIQQSRLVIVDLTEQRHTVFVEWGFALGKAIPTLLIVSQDYWDKAHGTDNKEVEKLEFYSKNYSIKIYKDEEHLKEIVESAIGEMLD